MIADVPGLLRQIAVGDPTAKAWLYDTYASGLQRKLSFRYGVHALDPEELLQDAFVAFYQHDGRVLLNFLDRHPPAEQTVEQLRVYLWDLACGVASNQLRDRRTRRRNLPESDRDLGDVGVGSDAEDRHIARDQMRRFVDCIAEKGAQIQLYFALRFVDGLTAEEISRVTGWPIAQVYRLRVRLGAAADECATRLQMDLR
jgi:DNA-directed RNA polymerase specialized sigma24 family protein